MDLVQRHGGVHHCYFLPAEGASDAALALFSFPGLTAYETYRARFGDDPELVEADRIRDESGCVLRHDRTFMRPLPTTSPALEPGMVDDPSSIRLPDMGLKPCTTMPSRSATTSAVRTSSAW